MTINMQYKSTRNNNIKVSSAHAIMQGISNEGGLFVPENIPAMSIDDIQNLAGKSYTQIADIILTKYLTDFTQDELFDCIQKAYTDDKFYSKDIAPVEKLYENIHMLELWHGPTNAFKDMALQLMPRLLTTSMKKVGNGKKAVILVATSGDTGKAALEGFMNVENTQIIVFYPAKGVSSLQYLQMVTQEGNNTAVCGIKGNFDDAQTAVKAIFTDEKMRKQLSVQNKVFSSANSINWGRLVPQIVYYITAYCNLLSNKKIAKNEKINFVVPTGNFGNILSAYYAKKMGLPINKLICASNTNNILTDFINDGEYNCNREFFTTMSPSMDIIISSNLERLIYHLSNRNDEYVKHIYGKLTQDKYYKVESDLRIKMQEDFYGGYCDETQTKNTIKRIFEQHNYLLDPHTAVGVKVYEDYKLKTQDNTTTIITSTANPYKFPESVVASLTNTQQTAQTEDNILKTPQSIYETSFKLCEQLNAITKKEIPAGLKSLQNAKIRFDNEIEPTEMRKYLEDNFC